MGFKIEWSKYKMTLPDMITKIRTFWFELTGMSRWIIIIIFKTN